MAKSEGLRTRSAREKSGWGALYKMLYLSRGGGKGKENIGTAKEKIKFGKDTEKEKVKTGEKEEKKELAKEEKENTYSTEPVMDVE